MMIKSPLLTFMSISWTTMLVLAFILMINFKYKVTSEFSFLSFSSLVITPSPRAGIARDNPKDSVVVNIHTI